MNKGLKFYSERKGTSDERFEYEKLSLVNLILGVFEKTILCYLSTNNAPAGEFEDICLERNNVTCGQVKHSKENSKLPYPKELEIPVPNAPFNVSKYLKSYLENGIQADRLILSTNRTFRRWATL